jgi:hypothetical protein
MGVQLSLLYPYLHSFRMVLLDHTAFHNVCTNLHTQQQCMRVLFSPYPHQHLLLFVFLIVAILTLVRWSLRVVLICISFLARDIELVLMFLSAVLMCSL